MKKIIPLSLALLFIFNLVGYYLAFPVVSWCYKSTVRAGMEAGILKKKLVLVKVPISLTTSQNNQFQLTDEDEFQYMGKMYDVSSQETKGDSIYYYCYADYDEDQQMAGLNDHVNSDSAVNAKNQKSDGHNTVIKALKEYVKTSYPSQNILQSVNFCLCNSHNQHFRQIVQDIHSPPPKS